MEHQFDEFGGWMESAQAWIDSQGDEGDFSRREILDPALGAILGDMSGLAVLDVGCGEGRYGRVMAARGASVTGIDPIPVLINRARLADPIGRYLLGSGESLPFADASFDIVLSYLSLVDIPDYRRAIAEMCRVVRHSGRIVIATISNFNCTAEGWEFDTDGRKLFRAVDNYMDEIVLDCAWKGIRIRNYHRPLSAVLQEFFKAGAVVDGFYEPLPLPASRDYADERRAPSFQIITFRFPAAVSR